MAAKRNYPVPQGEQLAAMLYDKEWLVPVILQLEKDFATAGVELKPALNGVSGFLDLYGLVFQQLAQLTERRPEALAQLLYRVDLSEKRLEEATVAARETPFARLLARLIILRELQKVVIRKHFSSK